MIDLTNIINEKITKLKKEIENKNNEINILNSDIPVKKFLYMTWHNQDTCMGQYYPEDDYDLCIQIPEELFCDIELLSYLFLYPSEPTKYSFVYYKGDIQVGVEVLRDIFTSSIEADEYKELKSKIDRGFFNTFTKELKNLRTKRDSILLDKKKALDSIIKDLSNKEKLNAGYINNIEALKIDLEYEIEQILNDAEYLKYKNRENYFKSFIQRG